MPYAQRDKKGKVKGLYANPQSGYAEEFLEEQNQEVQEFHKEHPLPPGFLDPLGPKDVQRLLQRSAALDREHTQLRNNIVNFSTGFAELEIALSALLYEILHIEPRFSKITYAIYFSPTGFAVRAQIVNNALHQLVEENSALTPLLPFWTKIYEDIGDSRRLRNAVAHGVPLTLNIHGKSHVRLTSPAFDVIRVSRKIASRQIPGLCINELSRGVKKLAFLVGRVDDTNRIITSFHTSEPKLLSERIAELETNMKKSNNP